ncbi:MAG: twin-arginine translocase TatA/TatE family subunit [Dongiaceae bacterium]
MGSFSIWHWLIVLAVVLLLFGGAGKIPKLMRDMGQGITAFKRGLKDENKGENKDESQEQAIDSSARVVEKDKVAS